MISIVSCDEIKDSGKYVYKVDLRELAKESMRRITYLEPRANTLVDALDTETSSSRYQIFA